MKLIKTDQSGRSLIKTHHYPTRNKELPCHPRVKRNQYSLSFLVKGLQCIEPFLGRTREQSTLKGYVNSRKKEIFITG